MQGFPRSRLALWAVVSALAAALLAYSQTYAGYADEGLHLLAAQLVNAGKRPYLDFFFQHAPLYLYFNAACLRWFGESWRAPHVMAAALTSGSILLAADYVYSRLQDRRWRLPMAITAACLIGLNTLVIQFGTISQPYAPCLFFGVLAFRFAVVAAERRGGRSWAAAGAAAGAAAASSMLAAPIGPVILLWMLFLGPGRIRRCLQFLVGYAVPFLPFLWLAAHGPRQAFFDVFQFQFFYRQHAFQTSLTAWDLHVFSEWFGSTQALVLAALTAVCIAIPSTWNAKLNAEMRLCAAIAGGLGLCAALAHPTFPQYFVMQAPFLGILGAFGLYSTGFRLWPLAPVRVACGLLALFVLWMFQLRPEIYPFWPQLEAAASTINRVAQGGGEMYFEDKAVYFAARRMPPPGMENGFASYMPISPQSAALLHVALQPQIRAKLGAGRFDAVLLEANDRSVDSLALRAVYGGPVVVTVHNDKHYLLYKHR